METYLVLRSDPTTQTPASKCSCLKGEGHWFSGEASCRDLSVSGYEGEEILLSCDEESEMQDLDEDERSHEMEMIWLRGKRVSISTTEALSLGILSDEQEDL